MGLLVNIAQRYTRPKKNNQFIDAGSLYSVALDKNGRAWAWGANASGQLGDNSTTSRATPVKVSGSVRTFCHISAGINNVFTVAIDKNGKAWGWGNNGNGALGDNTATNRSTPVSVVEAATKTFCKIVAGGFHTVAIDKNGRAWAWGNNSNGQLGNNAAVSRPTPVCVCGSIKTFCHIAAGNNHTLAIDKYGRAWGWGFNNSGQTGDNSATSRLTPVCVCGGIKTFCHIAAGNGPSLAIDKDGRAWGWGFNGNGQLGINSLTTPQRTPVCVCGAIKTFCKIDSGTNHTLAIDKSGMVWAWGLNAQGQLGNNTLTSQLTPVSVVGTRKTFCEIKAGNTHSLAIDKNGRAWAWGLDTSGQLGNPPITSTLSPLSVVGNRTFCKIHAAAEGSVAINQNGRVFTWGANDFGTNGDNTTLSRRVPVNIAGSVRTFCHVNRGYFHCAALDKNGKAWAWGINDYGQLGIGTLTGYSTPVAVGGANKTFCQIVTGYDHTIALAHNNVAWGWGYNYNGQLGINSDESKITPAAILTGGILFSKIAAGAYHSLGITTTGKVFGWGDNAVGQMGTNDINTKYAPNCSVAGVAKTFCEIAGGLNHSVAIDKNGRAWAWGGNDNGQLGTNSGVNYCTPVCVCGTIRTFCKIAAGNAYTAAIDKYGRAWTWGRNTFGQLGNNTKTNTSTPVSVVGRVRTFCHITCGTAHTLAIDQNGRAWAWGTSEVHGNLGIDRNPYTPVQVCTI